jgi:hypothetical protein
LGHRHPLIDQRLLGAIGRQQAGLSPAVEPSRQSVGPLVPRGHRRVGEDGTVDAHLLQVVLQIGRRFVAGEGAQMLGQGHPLVHGFERP